MKNIFLIFICLPVCLWGQQRSIQVDDFENAYKIEFNDLKIEIEGGTDLLPEWNNHSEIKSQDDTVIIEIMSDIENRNIRISECSLQSINIEMAYTTDYIFSWNDGKHRKYQLYLSEYRVLEKVSNNLFKTILYTSRERKFSDLTIGKLIEMMRLDGLEESFMNTGVSQINNISIGSYILKVSATDRNNNPYSKVLIFRMIFGC